MLRGSLDDTRIQARPGWRVDSADSTLLLYCDGTADKPLDALRTLCAAWWAGHAGPVRVRACDAAAAAALVAVGLNDAAR